MILIVSGSPRTDGNTDLLCNILKSEMEGMGERALIIRIYDYEIKPCASCRLCVERGNCVIQDGMQRIYPLLLQTDGMVVVSPVYFNSIPSQLKAFIDRTWCLRGKLRDKVGGVVVVGRRYGHFGAISTLISFMLKHEMILGMRGVTTFGFRKREVKEDVGGLEDVKKLARRVVELIRRLRTGPIQRTQNTAVASQSKDSV